MIEFLSDFKRLNDLPEKCSTGRIKIDHQYQQFTCVHGTSSVFLLYFRALRHGLDLAVKMGRGYSLNRLGSFVCGITEQIARRAKSFAKHANFEGEGMPWAVRRCILN